MQTLFQYIEGKTKTKFHGVVGIHFQGGHVTMIKQYNTLPLEFQFVIVPLQKVFDLVNNWINSKKHGIINIPFQHGMVGKPKECLVLKLEEL